MIAMLDNDSLSPRETNDRRTQAKEPQTGFPTFSAAIPTIIISLSFWLLLLFPQHWFNPLFSNLLQLKSFSEAGFFAGLGENERSVYFFRLISSLSSIAICIVLIWLNRKQLVSRSGSYDDSRPGDSKKMKLKFLIINTIFSLAILALFPVDFSQTSYISFFNFLVTHIIFFTITGPIIEELYNAPRR